MTVLLNILPMVVLTALAWIAYRRKSSFMLGVFAGTLLLYVILQPSYLPKGTVQRSEVPAFTESTASIEDRNSRPDSGEERDQRIKEKVTEGLDFLK